MITLQLILFVLALTVSVGVYGASVWVALKRPPVSPRRQNLRDEPIRDEPACQAADGPEGGDAAISV
jgi:hypothetical protein